MKTIKTLILAALVAPITIGAANADPNLIVDANSTLEQKIQRLLDREEIEQVIINYGLAFDKQDWALHRSVFTDEIEMDFTASLGGGLRSMTADEWVEGVRPFFANLQGTQHIAMPLTVEIDGDEAYVRSMLHAQHHLPNAKGGPVQTMVGYYDNWLVRTSDGWKIQKIVQTITWNEGNWYIIEKAAGIVE
ncbi:MAG: nuclear transport factor 2 family protein [Pseudomonadota bacterium]